MSKVARAARPETVGISPFFEKCYRYEDADPRPPDRVTTRSSASSSPPRTRRSSIDGPAPGHDGLEQLPRPDQRSPGQGSRHRRDPEIRIGLRRQPVPERHARPPRAARGAPRRVHAPGGGRHVLDGLPGQPRRDRLPRRQGRHRLPRQAGPRLHHRRRAPLFRRRQEVQAQRPGGPAPPDAQRQRGQGAAGRHRRRLLDGGRHRAAARDRDRRPGVRGGRHGRRRPRHRRPRQDGPRHGRALRPRAGRRPHHGHLLEIDGLRRRLHRRRTPPSSTTSSTAPARSSSRPRRRPRRPPPPSPPSRSWTGSPSAASASGRTRGSSRTGFGRSGFDTGRVADPRRPGRRRRGPDRAPHGPPPPGGGRLRQLRALAGDASRAAP